MRFIIKHNQGKIILDKCVEFALNLTMIPHEGDTVEYDRKSWVVTNVKYRYDTLGLKEVLVSVRGEQ